MAKGIGLATFLHIEKTGELSHPDDPNRTTYTIAADTPDRAFNADTATILETNDVLATLLRDLAARGVIDTA